MKDHILDILKVWGVNTATLGVVSLTNLEAILKILLTFATLIWTVVKIVKLLKGEKE